MDIALCIVVFALGAWFCLLFLRGRKPPRTQALYKCIPSFGCALLALYGALPSGFSDVGGAVLCAGLLLCAAADWVLEFRFLPGAMLFMLAHLFFIAGFVLTGSKVPNIICLIIVAAILYLLLALVRQVGEPKQPTLPLIAYIAVISLMAAYAFPRGALFAIGALLFIQSDALLGARLFGTVKGKAVSVSIMVPYYLALYLFALGCVFSL